MRSVNIRKFRANLAGELRKLPLQITRLGKVIGIVTAPGYRAITLKRGEAEWTDQRCPKCDHPFVAGDDFGLFCCMADCGWNDNDDQAGEKECSNLSPDG